MTVASRVAIITGAGSGIGRACALALLADGWSVALAGRRAEALQATVTRSGLGPERVVAVPTDVSDEASVHDLFEAAVHAFGRVDLLFNNAGRGTPPVDITELSADLWQQVVDVNLTGAFLCTREAFRVMRAQDPRGGRIINNGSISAHAPRPNAVAYTATKHAITGLTKSASLDGRKYDIACGQIDIGNAATQMTDLMDQGVLQADGGIAVEPRMDVEQVARALVFMASLPLDANVQFMTVMATKMPYIGRG